MQTRRFASETEILYEEFGECYLLVVNFPNYILQLVKADSIPYMESVKELDKLMSLKCPTMKLVLLGESRHAYSSISLADLSNCCAVSSSKQVFQSIEDYYSQYEEGPAPQQSGM